jgi:uncharacterized membrane protein YgdD (TMEM256/DUF423 family)
MKKIFLTAGAILAGIAVIGGAFGAHFLKTRLTPERLQTFETAVRYQFYHAFALIVVGILYKEFANKWIKISGYFFLAGIIFFSGSLYGLCASPEMRWLGPVTPFGGLCFILGWSLLALGITKKS